MLYVSPPLPTVKTIWPWYALVAMACFARMQLLFKYSTRAGFASLSWVKVAGVLLCCAGVALLVI